MIAFPQNFQNGQSSWPIARPHGSDSYSGLTRTEGGQHLVVHDSKEADGAKLSSVDGQTGQVESLAIDWSRTTVPEDLEAVSFLDGQPGQFMAVEGSRYNGRTPHMFLFQQEGHAGRSIKQFDLPDLPYEVEGLVTKERSDGDVLIVLGGRGGDASGQGTLHWGLYHPEDQSLAWSDQGTQGLTVEMPETLGENQRPIADLHLSAEGDLWAAGCTDNGDTGPFESMVYRVGRLHAESRNPVTLTLDHPHRVHGEKIEALDANVHDQSHFLLGSDNESFGGALQSLLTRV